jgi:hypothetical protein
MIAGIIRPNPMYRWPDQMIKVQTTALNASVSCRYRQVALFGVSRIIFATSSARMTHCTRKNDPGGVSNALFCQTIADPTDMARGHGHLSDGVTAPLGEENLSLNCMVEVFLPGRQPRGSKSFARR